MIAKILKFELLFLFILAVCSTLSFFIGPFLPDNYFSISSAMPTNWFLYYSVSLLEFVAYFSGLWTVMAFFSFTGLYVFSFCKRTKVIDVFILIPLMLFELIFLYWCFPKTVGMGPDFIFESTLTFWYQILFFVLSLIVFICCLLKGMDSFSFNFKKLNPSLLKLPAPAHLILTKVSEELGVGGKEKSTKAKKLSSIPQIFYRIQAWLRGEALKLKRKNKDPAVVLSEPKELSNEVKLQATSSSSDNQKEYLEEDYFASQKSFDKEVSEADESTDENDELLEEFEDVGDEETEEDLCEDDFAENIEETSADEEDEYYEEADDDDEEELEDTQDSEEAFEDEDQEKEEEALEDAYSDEYSQETEYEDDGAFRMEDEFENAQIDIFKESTDKNLKNHLSSTKKKLTQNSDEYFAIVNDFSQQKEDRENFHPSDDYFEYIADRIQDKLEEFKIDAQVIDVLKGPIVDTFELALGLGVKIAKITGIEEDLGLALKGTPVRIVYPLKNRETVGIEVPRRSEDREIIYLEDIFKFEEFKKNEKVLPIVMGKNVFGAGLVTDLSHMPHMLIAGTTGSGKSVFINSLLVSLLVKKSPSEMRLILIDPKQLELALYSKLPHLLLPVVTNAKQACLALLWATEEMERRYTVMREFGVRNLQGFNEKLKTASTELISKISEHYGDDDNYALPYIIIIIDEFADLMHTKLGKEIENNVCRLAGKARAAGIHLIVATQRPSVDVITGLIKSNFPTRVAFRVPGGHDSRTILNTNGAEKLLGRGDMLFQQGVETTRAHSAFVDEKEVEKFTDRLSLLESQYDEGALEYLEKENSSISSGNSSVIVEDGMDEADEELYQEAVKIVVEHRAASASMLQRKLRLGYNRASNIIDMLEQRGVIGPADGAKKREVFMSLEDL